MANALYDTFKQGLLNGDHNISSGNNNVQATLIDTADYTYSAAHTNYATEVASAAKVAVSGNLTSPTITNGVFDTADFTWSTVTGDQSEGIILFNVSLTPDTLIAYYDNGMTGMPVTPNGGDINVTVHTSGWFTL
jgi:hypothetical protein